ncbi:hypothetical protein BC835DRAFT_1296402, partial [Cytidiella melzeri]
SKISLESVAAVSICGQHVFFTQSDMDDSRFGVDENRRTVSMDFCKIGVLSAS